MATIVRGLWWEWPVTMAIPPLRRVVGVVCCHGDPGLGLGDSAVQGWRRSHRPEEASFRTRNMESQTNRI